MSSTRTLIIVEVALSIALSIVLNFIQIRLPINFMGGSISLAMLPIAVVALRRGMSAGATAGTIFGLFDLLLEPLILVPIQVLFDYPLPYLLFGLSMGMFSKAYCKQGQKDGGRSAGRRIALSSVICVCALVSGGILRLVSHTLSGVLFFSEYASDFFASHPTLLMTGPVDAGLNVWLYSVVYNTTYLLPSLIGTGLCLLLIAPILDKAVPVRRLKRR
jgi:thiamine transporter